MMLMWHSKFAKHAQKSNIYKSYYQAKEIYKPENILPVSFQGDASSFFILWAVSKQNFPAVFAVK